MTIATDLLAVKPAEINNDDADRLFKIWKQQVSLKQKKGFKVVGIYTIACTTFLRLERVRKGSVVPKLIPEADIIATSLNQGLPQAPISRVRPIAYRQLYAPPQFY